jgi:2-methylcitrate dehydratase PrpD
MPGAQARQAAHLESARETEGFTLKLAQRSSALRPQEIPADVIEVARQCLLDWFAVALAGSTEQGPRTLLEALSAAGEAADGVATAVGHRARLAPRQAALVNGTSAHVLDFDDVNLSYVGHVSVTVLPATLALAEQLDASVASLLTAFVAGYETACRAGVALGREPYLRGHHITATVGVIGAAAACARLLELQVGDTARALGIAASSAAGLKCNFATMTKSLHAGQASATGLLAALLAQRGFSASATAIEAPQGLASALGVELTPAEPPRGWHMRENLFKHHASCYFTHSALEGLRALNTEAAIAPSQIERVTLHVGELERGACAIPQPATALEVKFSIAHLAAMVLLGRSTTAIDDHSARDEQVIELRSLVELVEDGVEGEPTLVEVALRGGEVRRARRDLTAPARDLREQRRRLHEKFLALSEPVLGGAGALALAEAVGEQDQRRSIRELTALARP